MLHPTTRRLLAARSVRSVSQGALMVDLSLYLHALGWSGTAIGATLTGGAAMAALLSLVVGILSDRFKRKPFLINNEIVTFACGAAGLLVTTPWLLVPAIVLGGFGRGANGAAGPFAPAEQAWLAEVVAPERRGHVYSINTGLGFFGMGAGAVLATTPAWFQHWLEPAASFRPLFWLVVAGAVINMWLLAGASESRDAATRRKTRVHVDTGGACHRTENRMLRRLIQMNALNGLSIGLTGPLIAYWFALRFGIGPGAIAPVIAAALLLTGITSLITGRFTRTIGLVRAVVWTRGLAVILLAVLPLMPVYWIAAGVYLIRLALSGASLGARQAQVVSLVGDARRGLATSLNAASFQLPQSIGPTIAGTLIGAGYFISPFMIGSVLQAVYVISYARVFGRWERRTAAKTGPDEAGPVSR